MPKPEFRVAPLGNFCSLSQPSAPSKWKPICVSLSLGVSKDNEQWLSDVFS